MLWPQEGELRGAFEEVASLETDLRRVSEAHLQRLRKPSLLGALLTYLRPRPQARLSEGYAARRSTAQTAVCVCIPTVASSFPDTVTALYHDMLASRGSSHTTAPWPVCAKT